MRRDPKTHPAPPPAMGRDIFQWIRVLQTPSCLSQGHLLRSRCSVPAVMVPVHQRLLCCDNCADFWMSPQCLLSSIWEKTPSPSKDFQIQADEFPRELLLAPSLTRVTPSRALGTGLCHPVRMGTSGGPGTAVSLQTQPKAPCGAYKFP